MQPNAAVYYRAKPWKGSWKLFAETETLEAARNRVDNAFAGPAASGEVAIFVATIPAFPKSFTDGNEPGKLSYQVTALFRRCLLV